MLTYALYFRTLTTASRSHICNW